MDGKNEAGLVRAALGAGLTRGGSLAEKPLSLHGLGFIQLELTPQLRLHVWHPSLPRRRCFEHSSIHDHRWGFQSLVLAGMQGNEVFYEVPFGSHTNRKGGVLGPYAAYSHDGERGPHGNRPWTYQGIKYLVSEEMDYYPAGESYPMQPYVFHRTEPFGDGRCATLMTKRAEQKQGATSLCKTGVEPDVAFDRNQMSRFDMLAIIAEVLSEARDDG